MAKIYTDSLDRIVLDDETNDMILFDILDDKVVIYQDSHNELDRTALEEVEACLVVPLSDMPKILDQLKNQFEGVVGNERIRKN